MIAPISKSQLNIPPHTAPDDYVDVLSELTLDGSRARSCVNVTVLDDDILEPTEELVAVLTEDDTRVEVDRDQAIVQIADNDGKHNGRNIGQFVK